MRKPLPYLRQGAPQWKDQLLGMGPSTIGRSGCLLTAITQASRVLAGGELLPPTLNDWGRAGGGFSGSRAIIHKLAELAALQAPPAMRTGGSTEQLRLALLSALRMKWLALLHVDHDSALVHGDPEGDHWILALREVPEWVLCADPATGQQVAIRLDSLTGASSWASGIRKYSVRTVVPIGPASVEVGPPQQAA